VARHVFRACPVKIHTQSNITSILFTWVHYTNTANIMVYSSFNCKFERCSLIFLLTIKVSTFLKFKDDWRRISSPRTKLLAARCECLHLIKMNSLALRLDESAHVSLAASCEELRARTGNPPWGGEIKIIHIEFFGRSLLWNIFSFAAY
jgi:hypothetical protein